MTSSPGSDATGAGAPAASPARSGGVAGRLLLGAAALAALGAAWLLRSRLEPRVIVDFLAMARGWGPLAFVGLYALLALLLVPTLPLNLGAGVLWGPWLGGLYSAAGATLGGALAFLVARYVLGDVVSRRASSRRWLALRDELARNDWRLVAFTRLSPVFPTGALNYVYGVTPLRFATFLWSTLVFLLPGSIVFAALGSASGELVLSGAHRRAFQGVLAVAAAASLLVVLRWWSRSSRPRAATVVENTAAPPQRSL